MTEVQNRTNLNFEDRDAAGTVKAKSIIIPQIDEKARIEKAPKQPGLCVDEICSCYLHECYATRPRTVLEGDTTYRLDFNNKFVDNNIVRHPYTEDNCPPGVDPVEWKKYIAKHGIPKPDQIPASLYWKKTPETRDFTTEQRSNYTNNAGGVIKSNVPSYDENNPPPGIDLNAWKKYVAANGLPHPDKIPSWLYYKRTPDTRDFATNYRSNYVSHKINVCPINTLPPYPKSEWPRQHTFWDPTAKCWY